MEMAPLWGADTNFNLSFVIYYVAFMFSVGFSVRWSYTTQFFRNTAISQKLSSKTRSLSSAFDCVNLLIFESQKP